MLIPVEALLEYKGDYTQSATSMGAIDDFAPEPVLPLPYEEAISQGIGPQVCSYEGGRGVKDEMTKDIFASHQFPFDTSLCLLHPMLFRCLLWSVRTPLRDLCSPWQKLATPIFLTLTTGTQSLGCVSRRMFRPQKMVAIAGEDSFL